MSLHTSSMYNMHTHLQHLVKKCSYNKGGMNVQPAKLEVDGEPIFLKRRVIPYGQRDGVLQTLEKVKRDGIITRVTSSTWAMLIVIAIKSDGKTPRIPGDYRLTLNPRLQKCAATTIGSADFLKALHGSTCFSKIDLRNAANATTKESPAKLFKARSLRSSLRCVDSSDVVYFRGNDLRPSRGIITRKIGQAMVEITDLTDAMVHRRHIDQIHFNEPPTSTEDLAEETRGSSN
ncbi:unnamed protein product [Echinostoma caproni]|uniref:Doublecortin domain-containing protein n=1 Tax=Echinostoma caproni TaxID=27848 RepID=A0A183AXE6_9TREM|nr:unnamed protein product [Echinostoma caproni]